MTTVDRMYGENIDQDLDDRLNVTLTCLRFGHKVISLPALAQNVHIHTKPYALPPSSESPERSRPA